jgi:RNA polymerase sigma-70 factor (ECF subfamily)
MAFSPLAVSAEAAGLFEVHGAALYRLALVMLHHGEDAEDVVQTAFLRLMQHLQRGGDRTNLRAWLFTVTANLCRDRLRARRRWVPWNLDASESDSDVRYRPAGPLADGGRVSPQLDLRDPEEQFLAAVRELPPRDRLLLALRAQGLSYRELAVATGMRPASVGQSLARALARWRRVRETIAIT